MSYPEKLLADDEEIVEHLHPHWITVVPAALWFIVICVAGGFGIAYAPSSGTGHTVVVGIIVVGGLLLLGWLSLKPAVLWKTSHYVFTTHRVLIRRGFVRHTGRDIPLQRITDVGFSQSLWDRIVKAGTLSIESASDHGQEDLHNIPHSDRMQQLLNRLIEQDGERRARLTHPPQPQYPPQPGYPPQQYPQQPPPGYQPQPQYPPTQQYPQQPQPQYPPTQQYPPQQYPPQQ